MVPGLGDSPPGHWQSWLPHRHPGAVRVTKRDWDRPELERWASRIGSVLDRAGPGRWLAVAHSFGALALVRHLALVQAVKRDLVRFPEDFMFQLSAEEWKALRSQSVTSNAGDSAGRGGRRTAPYAFTEQGVVMLSSVLGSPRAIAVNIEIMRTFVRVRALAATHGDLAKRLAELEEKTEALAMNHDTFSHNTRNQLKQVFDALRELMAPPDPPKRPIGFINPEDKGSKKTSAARLKT